MIESTLLSSSTAWDTDLFQDFGAEISALNYEDSTDEQSYLTGSNDISCINSCDYDNLVFQDSEDIFSITDSFISEFLEESNSLGFSESDASSLFEGFEENNCPTKSNPVSSNNKSSRKQKKTRQYLPAKPWSKMSPKEQLETLHTLSEIVTCCMGIREQIEVIKIIDPTVCISPSDKEFALDSSSLNDSKMRRIRDYVRKHGFSIRNSKKYNSSSTSKIQPVKSKVLSRKVISSTKGRQKKQKTFIDENSRQRRKLELHGKKEARSGLFVYEKVIKKLNNPLEEDEDVNILE